MKFNAHARLSVLLAASASIAALSCSVSNAADFPTKRITLTVPYAAGGSSDAITRIYADTMKERFSQPIVVENKPGAGGYIAIESVARSTPADGHNIVLVGQQFATPKQMVTSPTFDPKELALIGRVAAAYFIIVSAPEVPARTLKEFIAYAKANPGKISYGTLPASLMQLDMARLAQTTQTQMLEVPFNGAAPIATALLGNTVQMSFLGPTSMQQIKAGKLIGLAVASKSRWGIVPDIASTAEQGLDYESGYWYGYGVPAGTPPDVFNRLTREFADASKVPALRDAIRKLGMDPIEPSPAEIKAAVAREAALNAEVIKSVNLGK